MQKLILCGKMCHSTFPCNFVKCGPIFKIPRPAGFSSRFLTKQYLDVQTHLKRVATLPCEMVVLKNRNDPQLSEANHRARLSHSKQLLKNIHQ